ncbi:MULTISPECIES: hypothetical protein [Kitasatospora]|uniref:hypothetical protein n=1 Tax=Kitasatospora TaxID=2063 RepID=UPI000C70E533|nr:hypothetical protein [Kitasatospora sp. GP30]MDH6145608.1 hypothetical protein [Kitasatospora sp. GP30]
MRSTGTEVGELAADRAAWHRRWGHQELRDRLDATAPDTPARRRLLTLGSAHEQSYATFWGTLAAIPDGTGDPVTQGGS